MPNALGAGSFIGTRDSPTEDKIMPNSLEVSYIPAGKIRCFITGGLRRETPEEHVRQRVARSLVEEYGYAKEDMELEFRIHVGRPTKPVDIAVFTHGEQHTQEKIFLIAETKREEIKPTDRDNGVGQLESYLAACLNAKWGLWVGSELRAYKIVTDAGERTAVEVADIPPYGKTQAPRITFQQLISAEGLRDVFKRCHNYIYANQGMSKERAFHELLKLIFCKVHDEQHTAGEMLFDVTEDERSSTLGQRKLRQRVAELFEAVKERYSYIFTRHERLQLDDRVLAYIVREMRRYSLLQTATDVKGEAYQEIVGANLRGDRGEFLTPPNVCQMAVRVVFATYPVDRWLTVRVLDPACGTGGFLRTNMKLWHDHILQLERKKWKRADKAIDEAAARLRELCDRNLFGIDINPELVRAAQMNLVMHGDGSCNVFQGNSLLPPAEWREELKQKVSMGSFDIVFTNPPFGAGPGLVVDDPHILDQFELSRFEARGPRGSMPPEQLFIERCHQFLKPGGRMAIVLPDSILSNPGLLFVRRWMLKRFRIIASIDLPVETFLAFGGTGTQTSVLVLESKTSEQFRVEQASGVMADYDLFMALCKTAGYDRRGKDLWLRTPEGDEIWRETVIPVMTRTPDGAVEYEGKREARRVRDDEVSQVSALFAHWLNPEATKEPKAR